MTKKKTGDQPGMTLVNPGAAAVDTGSTMHMAAVSPGAMETISCHSRRWTIVPDSARPRELVKQSSVVRIS
jgi:hypothetical protein